MKHPEFSLYGNYIDLIKNAEHFIYIESQFFISSTGNVAADQRAIRNEIALALVKRIAQAFQQKKKFRVIIILPLQPEGFFYSFL